MILSVSRRTDIPAFYSNWFFNRIKAGFVDVRNPMNIHRISRIDIRPSVVDCIVFWTKNPRAMIGRLDELSGYKYYFQFTVNPYDKHIEEEVLAKTEHSHPLGMVVSTHFRCGKGVKRGLKNGALPFTID